MTVGFLAYADWDDVEESVVVAIDDCTGAQMFRDFSVEWFEKERAVRVVTKWSHDKPPVHVQLGDVAVDQIAECSLKFCWTQAEAVAWLNTQTDS